MAFNKKIFKAYSHVVFRKNMTYIMVNYFSLFHYTEFNILYMQCKYQFCFEKYISSKKKKVENPKQFEVKL